MNVGIEYGHHATPFFCCIVVGGTLKKSIHVPANRPCNSDWFHVSLTDEQQGHSKDDWQCSGEILCILGMIVHVFTTTWVLTRPCDTIHL